MKGPSLAQNPNQLRRWLKTQRRKAWPRMPRMPSPVPDPTWSRKPLMGRAAYRASIRVRLNVEWDDAPFDMGAAILAAYEQLNDTPPQYPHARARLTGRPT